MSPERIYYAILTVTQFIILLTFHEWGHAKSANMLGDSTARDEGRMSLNPAVHIDPIGTLFLPLIGSLFGGGFFGWAKPVPVNPYNLKNPRFDIMLIAAAGPVMNILLTIVIFYIILLYEFLVGFISIEPKTNVAILIFLRRSALISVFLAIFNMLPLFPLDGFSVVNGLLPERASREFSKLAPYGMPILMLLLFVPSILNVYNPLQLIAEISYAINNGLGKIIGVF
ncbi:site-2 protease family protein [Candidatus Poribacteria bacterium]|nr:site-2 protease family protein [Candidatus Poribacteria bacterium]